MSYAFRHGGLGFAPMPGTPALTTAPTRIPEPGFVRTDVSDTSINWLLWGGAALGAIAVFMVLTRGPSKYVPNKRRFNRNPRTTRHRTPSYLSASSSWPQAFLGAAKTPPRSVPGAWKSRARVLEARRKRDLYIQRARQQMRLDQLRAERSGPPTQRTPYRANRGFKLPTRYRHGRVITHRGHAFGHATAPKKYRQIGATTPAHYAWPGGFMYPISDVKHVRLAAGRFGKHARRYPAAVRAVIQRRLDAAKRHFRVGKYHSARRARRLTRR